MKTEVMSDFEIYICYVYAQIRHGFHQKPSSIKMLAATESDNGTRAPLYDTSGLSCGAGVETSLDDLNSPTFALKPCNLDSEIAITFWLVVARRRIPWNCWANAVA